MKKLLGISLVWILLAGSIATPLGIYSAFATGGQSPVSTSTVLRSNTISSIFGHSVTFTATISPSTANGTVQFNDSSTILGTSTISSGQATFTTSSLSVGSHNIVAKYLGDANDATSTGTLTQTVNHVATTSSTVSLSSNATSVVFGHSITFTATISPSTATGTVQLLLNATNFGAPVTISSGQATFTTSSLPGGSYSVVALYSGDVNVSPSISNSVPISTIVTGSTGSGSGDDDNHDEKRSDNDNNNGNHNGEKNSDNEKNTDNDNNNGKHNGEKNSDGNGNHGQNNSKNKKGHSNGKHRDD